MPADVEPGETPRALRDGTHGIPLPHAGCVTRRLDEHNQQLIVSSAGCLPRVRAPEESP